MEKTIPGTYHAITLKPSLEVIGKNQEYPIIRFSFRPYEMLQGVAFVEGKFTDVEKLFFLEGKSISAGRHVGLSPLEACRATLLEVYNYDGTLTPESLAGLENRRVEIVVKAQRNTKFNSVEVAFVNALTKEGPKKRGGAIPDDVMKRLAGKWGGNSQVKSAATWLDQVEAKSKEG